MKAVDKPVCKLFPNCGVIIDIPFVGKLSGTHPQAIQSFLKTLKAIINT